MAAQPPQSFPPPGGAPGVPGMATPGVRPAGGVVNSPLMRGNPRINSPLMGRGRGAGTPTSQLASPRSPLGAPPLQAQTYQQGQPARVPPGGVAPNPGMNIPPSAFQQQNPPPAGGPIMPPSQLPPGISAMNAPQTSPQPQRTIVSPAIARGRGQPKPGGPGGLHNAPSSLPAGATMGIAGSPPASLPAGIASTMQPTALPPQSFQPASVMPSDTMPTTDMEALASDPSMMPIMHTARAMGEINIQESPDRDAETRTLCDYMIQELEKGIRMQRTSDYKDVVIKYVKEGEPSLVLTEPRFEGLETTDAEKEPELLCRLSDLESVSGKPEFGGKQDAQRGPKLLVLVVFRLIRGGQQSKTQVTFQCKDKNAYVNMVDGIGALLGRSPRSYERVRDLQTIAELYRLAQIYGPPALPPAPTQAPPPINTSS